MERNRTTWRISDDAVYANMGCIDETPLPPLRDACACAPGILCDQCYEHEQCGRLSRKKLNRSVGVRISLLTPEEEYIHHMTKQMLAWQKANGHDRWMPSLHHIQGHQGLPSRRAIQAHLGDAGKVYAIWLAQDLITQERYDELMIQVCPLEAREEYEGFFIARCRQWQQRHNCPGWMPVVSHFNRYKSLPSTRAIRARYKDSAEIYALFYREGLITQERYDELVLVAQRKTNAVNARKGRGKKHAVARRAHASSEAAD